MSQMVNHLPECFVTTRTPSEPRCICDRLRQAEQRVRSEQVDTRAGQVFEHINLTPFRGRPAEHYRDGYAAGVTAARDAVAALPANPAGYSYGIPRLDKDAALAAIDKLRGETND